MVTMAKEAAKTSREETRDNMDEAVAKGTAVAFRALKPALATATGRVTEKGNVLYSAVAVLKEQRARRAHWWDENGKDDTLDEMPQVPAPKLVDIEHLRHVSSSFKTQTCCIDGLHPRHINGLTDPALTGLAYTFRCFEALGQWPKSEQAVLTALIPNTDGGLRPIALFRTIFCIYATYRSHIVKQWAVKLPDAQCNNSAGRWVGDSTWRMQIRAITSTARKFIEFLLDVRKAFEHVQRGHLLQEATINGYPLVDMLASITSYNWPRYITCEGLLAEPIVPKRGIPVGSAFATFELWNLLRTAIMNLQIAHPLSTICLHVDDLCLTATRKTNEEVLIEADSMVAMAIEEFTGKKGLPFADDETFVISTDLALTKAAAKKHIAQCHGR